MATRGFRRATRTRIRADHAGMGKKNRRNILRSTRLGEFVTDAAKYTSSVGTDARLVESVVLVNEAHILMLHRRGILDKLTAAKLASALQRVPKNLKLDESLEDVHMNVERYVMSKVGEDFGGMLNLGKSRNDQVATALRIALRNELLRVGRSVIALQGTLLRQASKHSSSVLPGYTHLQRAQPVTLGHQLLAHFDSLQRDFERIVDAYVRVNLSPMGAGALVSTGFPIDRQLVAKLLGFDSVMENSLDAVSSRDFATGTIFVCAQIMTDLSRLSEELILWSSTEFSFAEVSNRFTSTSSMMPQKKNPVVAEIQRARTSQVLGDLVSSLSILRSLPLSYNLDLQELTTNLWHAIDRTAESLEVMAKMVEEVRFDTSVMAQATNEDDTIFATEIADYLVSEHGLSFRQAHNRVAALVRVAMAKADGRVEHCIRTLGSIELSEILRVKVSDEELDSLTDPRKVLSKRTAIGAPAPADVARACRSRRTVVFRDKDALSNFKNRNKSSKKALRRAVEDLSRKEKTRESSRQTAKT